MKWISYAVLLQIVANSVFGDEYILPLSKTFTTKDVLQIPGARLARVYNIGDDCKAAKVSTHGLTRSMAGQIEHKIRIKLTPNPTISALDRPTPKASCYEQKTEWRYWGLTRMSTREKPGFEIGDSYKFSSTGKCVNIYVVDTGVNIRHKTFGDRARVGSTPWELLYTEGEGDLTGHGTHVAGLAAGKYHTLRQ